ncbi:PRP38 family-domain-containing protein [Scheffersomyces amazonensis]|uniref:PRP38 family-domain-containing protein n=1 Tax=Scheffersomyces amazonensis TaxID=1078765 RepID=UPI00315D63A6
MSTNGTNKKKIQPSYLDKRNVVNKAYLIEPIIRHRIQDSLFYKQYLYLTNEATILPIIIDQINYIAGTDSIGKPSPFLSCLFRLLELDPSQEIIDTYLTQLGYNEFKYLTALILIYIRLTSSANVIYSTFDKYGQDFRKLRVKLRTPEFSKEGLPINYKLSFMDEWIDSLLNDERVVNIILPRLVPRLSLVESEILEPRKYYLDSDASEDDETETNNDIHHQQNNSDDFESDSD